MALTLDRMPGFADLPDTAIAAEELARGVFISRISQNASFGIGRAEVFVDLYKNGETVNLPTSDIDGYLYSREECMYFWAWHITGSADSGYASYQLPWTLWYIVGEVDQTTGDVTTKVGYRGNADHADRQADTEDGVLQVFTIAQRNTGLIMSAAPTYTDIDAAEFYTDRALDEDLIQGMNRNAKFAVVNCEFIDMGEFSHGGTVAQPVSPVDGYTYPYANVKFMTSVRWTADGTTAPIHPAESKGQLQDWSCSVNASTGAVTIAIKYERSGVTTYNTGRIRVLACCQRSTSTGLTTADDFAEINEAVVFAPGQTLRASSLQQVNDNIRQAAFSPEFFFVEVEDGDVVNEQTSPIDGYLYTYAEQQYVFDYKDTGASDHSTDRMSLAKSTISSVGVVSIDMYRFASGGSALHLEDGGTLRVIIFAKRGVETTFPTPTTVTAPTDTVYDDGGGGFLVNGV